MAISSIFGQPPNDYQNQLNQNQSALQNAHSAWQNQADAYRYAQMSQSYNPIVNPNQSMIDILRKIGAPKMVACIYATSEEEITWALLQDYEKSLTQPDLYIKWEK